MNSIHKEMISREQVEKDQETFTDVVWTGFGLFAIAALIIFLGGF